MFLSAFSVTLSLCVCVCADAAVTDIGFVQSRGRARYPQAKYVVACSVLSEVEALIEGERSVLEKVWALCRSISLSLSLSLSLSSPPFPYSLWLCLNLSVQPPSRATSPVQGVCVCASIAVCCCVYAGVAGCYCVRVRVCERVDHLGSNLHGGGG